MKQEVIQFVAGVVRQRTFLMKNNLSMKDRAKVRQYCRVVKANLIDRNRLTEVACKKIFLKYQNEIRYLIPSGSNPSFQKKEQQFQELVNTCMNN